MHTTLKNIQSFFSQFKKPGESVVDELIQERREEAKMEDAEVRELKHWERHANAIELQDDKTANVFYIMRWSDGALWMGTQRVSSWHVEFSPSDAIEALQEAIAWIRENTTTVNPPEST